MRALLALLLLVGGCAGQSRLVILEETSACSPLHLVPGQELQLQLPSDPTSGFRWQIDKAASKLLLSLGPEIYSHSGPGLIGEAGQSNWRFRVIGRGEDQLQLTYRSVLDSQLPSQQFTCQLKAD